MNVSTWERGLLLALASASLVAWPLLGEPAAASCAAPRLSVPGTDAGPGSGPAVMTDLPFDVDGRGFVDGCNDTGGGSVWGCSTDEGEAETPLSDVELVVRQDGRTWELETADAGTAEEGRMGHVTWRVTLPTGLSPGRAVLVAGDDTRLPVRVARSTR